MVLLNANSLRPSTVQAEHGVTRYERACCCQGGWVEAVGCLLFIVSEQAARPPFRLSDGARNFILKNTLISVSRLSPFFPATANERTNTHRSTSSKRKRENPPPPAAVLARPDLFFPFSLLPSSRRGSTFSSLLKPRFAAS